MTPSCWRSGWSGSAGRGCTPVGCPRRWRRSTRRCSAGRPGGLAGHRRLRLLHDDRGLPGDLGLRPRRGVDRRPPAVVRAAARPGGVHGPVRGAPRTADAGAGGVGRGDGRARGRPAAVRRGRLDRGDRGRRLRDRRGAPAAGDHAAAEAAYQSAGDHGFDPQPGLALLWLAQGRTHAATAAVRRLLAEATDPVHRSRVLPTAVEVLVAADALDDARTRVARARADRRVLRLPRAARRGGVLLGPCRAHRRRPGRRAAVPAQGDRAVARGSRTRTPPLGCGC